MQTTAIDRELAQELERLAEAKAQAAKVAEKLAVEPGNKQHRLAVLEAQAQVDEISVTVDALNLAREQAVKFDQSEEGQATRAKRLAMVQSVRNANAQVIASATAVDKALAALRAAAQEFATARSAAQETSAAYLDLNECDLDARMHNHEALNRAPSNVAHALALTLHEIVVASGLDCGDFITFNPYALTPTSGVGGAFMFTLSQAAQANAESAREALAHIEAVHTGTYTPPSPVVPGKHGMCADHFIAANFGELMEHVAAVSGDAPIEPADTHTIAADWDGYLKATANLPTPEVLHDKE